MKEEKKRDAEKKIRIALFGGSLNPPHIPHEKIARELSESFDLVYVIPCGHRKDKCSTNSISIKHRMEMAKIAFSDMPGVILDLSDLENNVYTTTYELQKKYEKIHPEAEIWHLIGEDIIAGGRLGASEIHKVWDHGNYIWEHLNFLVILRPDYGAKREDMPPKSETMVIEDLVGSGTWIRKLVRDGRSIEGLVSPKIKEYIEKNGLYLE